MKVTPTNGRFQRRLEYQPEKLKTDRPAVSAGWDDSIERWIGRHPLVCVMAALAAGASLGWFIKRR
jgi:hypothetical protein